MNKWLGQESLFLEILKSIVYGGLMEVIASLSVAASAAASDAATLKDVTLQFRRDYVGKVIVDMCGSVYRALLLHLCIIGFLFILVKVATMAWLPLMVSELRSTSKSANWEPMFVLYCQRSAGEDYRLAREINRVAMEVNVWLWRRINLLRSSSVWVHDMCLQKWQNS
ncbi:hypothetical protein Tco_1502459 [Tanacetum coccineum]